VKDGTSLTFQDASAATDNLSSRCNASDTGGVLYYSASIGAGQALTATATSIGSWLPSLRLLASCNATSCLASSGSSPNPKMQPGASLTYFNAGASPANVILAVGPAGMFGPPGYFDLNVSIATPPYTLTTIGGACDDTTSATSLALTGRGTASPPSPLPFSVAYFGDAMTQFSVSSSGFVQLFGAPGGQPTSPVFLNAPIPTTAPPNGMIAAYWDDLVLADPSARAAVLTSGTSPNRHFTIEWKNLTRTMDPTSRLTFQAKVFETTNVIEIHYCALTNASGETASIGIENATGALGVQAGYYRAGIATTSSAYRFTPAP
jgi:hypothetical protein